MHLIRVIIELYLEILINILQTSCALKFISNKIGIYGTCNKSFVVKLLKTFIGVSFSFILLVYFQFQGTIFVINVSRKITRVLVNEYCSKTITNLIRNFNLSVIWPSRSARKYFIFSLDIFVIYMLKWCTSLTFPYMILLGLSFFNNCLPLAKHLLLPVFSFH